MTYGRRFVRLGILVLIVACGDPVAPTPDITVRITGVAPTGLITAFDEIRLVGDASASDVGLLPDSSLSWFEDTRFLGRGREVTLRATAGTHRFRLVAHHAGRSGGDVRRVTVAPAAIGEVRWSVPLSGERADALAMGPGGVLYATEAFDVLVAIDRTGTVRWRHQLAGYGRWVPPAIAPDGTILVPFPYWNAPDVGPSQPGGVLALNPDGTNRWVFFTANYSPPGLVYYHVHGGVAVDGEGRVSFGSEERHQVMRWALSPEGDMLWRTAAGVGYDTWSSTVLAGDSLVLTMPRVDSTAVLSAASGEVRWFAPSPYINYCTVVPAVGADGAIYYVSRANGALEYWLRAVGPSGTVRWSRRLPAVFIAGSPILGQEGLYFGSASGGVLKLSYQGDTLAVYGPSIDWFADVLTLGANGVTYVAARDTVFSYAADGARRFAVPLPITPDGSCYIQNGGPVIGDDGTVYVRTLDAVVAIRDTVGPATDAPWPTLQGSFRRAGRRATDF